MKDYSKCLDKISLREKERQLDFEHLLETEISICPDPTLLLERKDYEKFEEDIDLPSKYILLYGFHDDEYVKKVEKVLSTFDSDEYEIIDLSIDKIFIKDHKVLNLVVTPGQFLTCFKNASYVITNSFHGTVFSIIYEKKFITILKSNTGGRMKELLSVLNLERRIFDSSRLLEDVDYEQVRIKLKDYRLIGSRYLESVL